MADYKLTPGMHLLVHSSKSVYEVFVGQPMGTLDGEGVHWYYYAFAPVTAGGARKGSWGAPTSAQINAAQARGLS